MTENNEPNEPIQTKDAGQQWEYKQTSGATEESLNKLGNENWELVAIGPTGYCTFKRPKPARKQPVTDYGYGR